MKNPLIDASFILQGFLGLGWVSIFGHSFTSLRVLTIIFGIIFLIGFYKILLELRVKPNVILLAFFCLLIEPFILTSSLSFMTEIYFLTFMIWSIYFFIKFLDNESKNYFSKFYFLTAILIGSLSILIRQFGIVLLIGYLLTLIYKFKFTKNTFKYSFLTILFFVSTIYINLRFPQYSGIYDSKEEKMLQLFADFNDIAEKLQYYPKYLVYLIFTISPFLVNFKTNLKRNFLILLNLPLTYLIYSIDIFDLKNVFHLECFYCESNFYHVPSLFDNIFFKLGISFFISYLIINTIVTIYEKKVFRKIKIDNKNFILIILSLGMLFITLAVSSFYDRYFVNLNVLLIILLARNLNEILILNRFSILTFVFSYLIIFLLNMDFHNSMYYKWNQALNIYEKTDKKLKAQIFVVGTFSRYMNALEKPPEDLVRPVKFGIQKCYVLRHIQNSNNNLIKFLESKYFNNKYISNPTFSNKTNINEIPKTSDNLYKVIKIDEYYSPIYNLLGQRTYIISFCNNEVTERFNLPIQDVSYIKWVKLNFWNFLKYFPLF